MNRLGVIQVLVFFVYLFFQVIILKHAVLFHTAFCFLYVAFLLSLPVETNKIVLMLAGFVMGFVIDIFYDSLGLHAMASVLIMYLRNYWLIALTPQGGYDSSSVPSLAAYGPQWFIVYCLPLILVHHAVLFYTEAGGFGYFWHTLSKVFASTGFTLITVLIVEYIFPGRRL